MLSKNIKLSFLFAAAFTVNSYAKIQDTPCIDCTIEANTAVTKQNNILVGYLHDNCFDDLEKYFTTQQQRYESGQITDYEMQNHFDAFRLYSPQKDIVNWLKKYPESFSANLIMGLFYRNTAFNFRGSAYASETPDINFSLMNQALEESEKYFNKSIELTKENAYIKTYLLRVYVYEGRNNDYKKLVMSLLQDTPNAITPYPTIMEYLHPKWGGSIQQMAGFLNYCKSRNLPEWQLNRVENIYLVPLYHYYHDAKPKPYYEKALDVAKREYAIAPDVSNKLTALRHMAQTKQQIEHKDIKANLEAIEHELNEIKLLAPDDLYAIGMLGLLDVYRGKVEEGINALKVATSSNQSYPDGDSISEYNLGMIYLTGHFVPKDDVLAKKYLLMAQKQGHKDAGYQLTKLGVITSK